MMARIQPDRTLRRNSDIQPHSRSSESPNFKDINLEVIYKFKFELNLCVAVNYNSMDQWADDTGILRGSQLDISKRLLDTIYSNASAPSLSILNYRALCWSPPVSEHILYMCVKNINLYIVSRIITNSEEKFA